MTTQTNLIPVWPGPQLLVPMATDILLVGNPDQNTIYADTRNSYYDLYMTPGAVLPAPFTTAGLATGAHIMWSLPYSLRQGVQTDVQADIDFPLVPNRWLVTRFKYPSAGDEAGGTVTPPEVTARIVQSDTLFDISSKPAAYNQYPYPEDTRFPIRGIGVSEDLSAWEAKRDTAPPFLKAVGPGAVSWSVAYDNINNVFSLYDSFGPDATAAAVYTYSIIGWYANPDDDVLCSLPVNSSADWKAVLETRFNWSLGPSVGDVDEAIAAWLVWQDAHGLKGPFDPNGIHLPEQEKAAIIAWYNWQQANGVTAVQANLPTKLLCHSMVASVNWLGSDYAYGTGVPGDYKNFPAVAVGNNATEAISVYMANKVAEELGADSVFILEIERALAAFQKDLLFDLANNQVNTVESQLHSNQFELAYGGQQWVVILPESKANSPQATGGQQTIPLDAADTQTLIALNALQAEHNDLYAIIASQRDELFMLTVKQRQLNKHTDQAIKTKVTNSIAALKTVLTSNLAAIQAKSIQIADAAQTFQVTLGDKYVLKTADLQPNAAPNDPVVMLAGGKLDSKLNAPGQYKEEQQLFVRVTGQTVTGIAISYKPATGSAGPLETLGAEELLAAGNVQLPIWNAIPKEAMDLWVETLILDTNNAPLLAKLYFIKAGITPGDADLKALTLQIQTQQTVLWNDAEKLGVPPQSLAYVAGINGIPPSEVAVAFRNGQPWTPIYLDWKITWFPTSPDPAQSLTGWKLSDIDYTYTEPTIPEQANKLIFAGRTLLNTKIAQNIQLKFASFEDDPNYDSLPDFILTNLIETANEIKNIDIVTQSMGGLGKQLATEIIAMNNYPTDQSIAGLLGDSTTLFRPVVGSETVSGPFFPIRSGHFQIIDLWMVDSFGQIWRGKDPSFGEEAPIPNIYWSESLTTPAAIPHAATYGQLPPRLIQPAQLKPHFLQGDNDAIQSNSSELTSPICGWVMANHLDNSLMVFDAAGNNLGAVIKIQRQQTEEDADASLFSIRWDAVPGSNTQLGAPPQLPNIHLQNFILGLLDTAPQGSTAYDDLMAAIDSTLWTKEIFPDQQGNLSVLLGRPLAVARAELGLSFAGMPLYNQSWPDTGRYYDNNGQYDPHDPNYVSVPFYVRIGDSFAENNGVMGYFEADNYHRFYAVYGANGQTTQAAKQLSRKSRRTIGSNRLLEAFSQPASFSSQYVEANHLVTIAPSDQPIKLTVLIDPSGGMPLVAGSLPTSSLTLPNGPVSKAMEQFVANFRAGPLLLDPMKIKMPTPAEVKGNWDWVARLDVTTWNPGVGITNYTPVATLETEVPKLIEGWMTLSNTYSPDQQ